MVALTVLLLSIGMLLLLAGVADIVSGPLDQRRAMSSVTDTDGSSRLDTFDRELRQLLADASDDGRFSERMGPVTASIWR